jgi:hypothetical protein
MIDEPQVCARDFEGCQAAFMQPGFTQKIGVHKFHVQNFKKLILTHSAIFAVWQRYTLYGQKDSDESGI